MPTPMESSSTRRMIPIKAGKIDYQVQKDIVGSPNLIPNLGEFRCHT